MSVFKEAFEKEFDTYLVITNGQSLSDLLAKPLQGNGAVLSISKKPQLVETDEKTQTIERLPATRNCWYHDCGCAVEYGKQCGKCGCVVFSESPPWS